MNSNTKYNIGLLICYGLFLGFIAILDWLCSPIIDSCGTEEINIVTGIVMGMLFMGVIWFYISQL